MSARATVRSSQPYKLPAGIRSLAKARPDLARQWDMEKNAPRKPESLSWKSNTRVWWRCPKGPDHSWQEAPWKRTQLNDRCPCCAGYRFSVTNSLAAWFPKVAAQWHPSRNGRLTPETVKGNAHQAAWWRCPAAKDHEWRAVISERTVAAKPTGCPFCKGKRVCPSNSLATLFPKVAAQWDTRKNVRLTPESVVPGSNKRVWWRCKKGADHRWRTMIRERTLAERPTGCPFCVGKRASKGHSLADRFPKIAAQWHPTRNGRLTPHEVTPASGKKAWWTGCPVDPRHEWRSTIANRTRQKTGCAICKGNQVMAFTSLAKKAPKVAALWHPTQNGALTPWQVSPKSNRLFWWKCPKGRDHEWRAPPNRVNGWRRKASLNGCPFCYGRRLSVTNRLSDTHPALCRQWHPRRNGKLTPAQVTYKTSRRVWWRCPKGPDHEWQAPVAVRTKGTGECPFCRGQRVSVTNSLASQFPEVAAQWHPRKNGTLSPTQVVAGSVIKAWWLCGRGEGHEWQAVIWTRTRNGYGCPFCAGHRVAEARLLAKAFPEIAAEWDGDRNGNRTPYTVAADSSRTVWWRCRRNPRHIWRERIDVRTRKEAGCPDCGMR